MHKPERRGEKQIQKQFSYAEIKYLGQSAYHLKIIQVAVEKLVAYMEAIRHGNKVGEREHLA